MKATTTAFGPPKWTCPNCGRDNGMKERPAPGHSVKRKCSGCDEYVDVEQVLDSPPPSISDWLSKFGKTAENGGGNTTTNKNSIPYEIHHDIYHNKYWKLTKYLAPVPLLSLIIMMQIEMLLNLSESFVIIPYFMVSGVFAYIIVQDKKYLYQNLDPGFGLKREPTTKNYLARFLISFLLLLFTAGVWPFFHLMIRRLTLEIET